MNNEGQGCVDTITGNIVFRHNTTTNCLVTSHGSIHHGGPQNFELYNNNITMNSGADSNSRDCYRCFHHQGSGEFLAFNNVLTPYSGHNSDAIAMLYYRDEASLAQSEGGVVCDGTQTGQTNMDGVPVIDGNRSPTTIYRGYPCWHQPGRDFAGNLKPMYAWGNKWGDTGAKIDLIQEDYGGYFAQHWVVDRDSYNAVGGVQTSPTFPFNGTTGVGYGTLANRPATCSVGKTDPADAGKGGVGYFATDVGLQGTLYRCAATNTWTVHYAPYTYPHPLNASGGSSLFLASDVPAFVNVNGTKPLELGVKFTSLNAGNITGVRFYKGSQDTGTHSAHLWSATGTLLASATFANETASGWQQVNLPTPVAITAGTTYVASYHTSGYFSGNGNYFATAHTNGPLTAPDSASSGGNGVYAFGSTVRFPSNTYIAANFWVDVVLQ